VNTQGVSHLDKFGYWGFSGAQNTILKQKLQKMVDPVSVKFFMLSRKGNPLLDGVEN
jgi:hypothetical protein